MNIYGIDGQPIITNIRLNANCKHEEEMMKSNFVKLSFRHSKKRELPIGAYVVVDASRDRLRRSPTKWLSISIGLDLFILSSRRP